MPRGRIARRFAGVQHRSFAQRGTGITYAMVAGSFDGASAQRAFMADVPSLSMGAGVQMSMAGWIFPTSSAALQIIWGKTLAGAAATNEYYLRINTPSPTLNFICSSGAANQSCISPAVTLSAWTFVVVYKDAANIGISINNGAFASSAFASDIVDGTQNFAVGGGGTGTNPYTGRVDSLGLWKRVLTGPEITQLYNAGVGMSYADLTAGLKTTLISWWDFDNNWNDANAGNNLTPVNSPTFAAGIR